MTTADQAWLLFESVKTKHGQSLAEFKTDDGLVYQTHTGVIPVSINDVPVELTIPPTASDAIQNAADHILTDPRISVPPRPGDANRDDVSRTAERLQQFYATFWNNIFAKCGDPLGYGKTQLIKGKMVLKFGVNWDSIPELPDDPTRSERDKFKRQLEKAGRSTFLFDVRMLPKETVYEVGDPRDPDAVFEEYQITHLEAGKRFNRLADLASTDPLGMVDYVEMYEKPRGSSKGAFIQWVGGDVVHEAQNPYCWEHDLSEKGKERYDGFVPYVIGDPGWGDMQADSKPEDRYVSLIRRSRGVFRGEIEMMTSLREFLKTYVFPPIKATNFPDKDISFVPGAVFDLQEGQDIEVMRLPELPQGVLQGLQRMLQYVDQTSKLGTLGGTPMRGVDTATEADQTIRNAAAKLSGPIRTLRWMVMRVNEMLGMTVENVIEAPVTLYGTSANGSEVTVKPSDFKGLYLTEVELDTSDEAALNLNNARTWSDLAQRLPISMKYAMRQAGIMNASQEMDERLMEDIERSDPAVSFLIGKMLEFIGAAPTTVPATDEQSQTPTPQDSAPKPETIDQQQRQAAEQAAPARAFR